MKLADGKVEAVFSSIPGFSAWWFQAVMGGWILPPPLFSSAPSELRSQGVPHPITAWNHEGLPASHYEKTASTFNPAPMCCVEAYSLTGWTVLLIPFNWQIQGSSTLKLSPSIHKFDNVFIHSGLSAEWAFARVVNIKICHFICESKHLVGHRAEFISPAPCSRLSSQSTLGWFFPKSLWLYRALRETKNNS